jgi:hypothetical protein
MAQLQSDEAVMSETCAGLDVVTVVETVMWDAIAIARGL